LGSIAAAGCIAGAILLDKLAGADNPSEKVEQVMKIMAQETPAPTPTFAPTPKTSEVSSTPIVLVNWENPIQGEPGDLVPVAEVCDIRYVDLLRGDLLIGREAGLAANRMFQAASEEGVGRFLINSAYRTVEAQEKIWNARIEKNPDYGQDPYVSPVKAMPGNMSEHATGLALDILSATHNRADDSFGDTEEAIWLAKNAHKFGFIQRYPEDKENVTGVIYEPWHYRYVGVGAATEIYEKGLCLEEYLEGKGNL